MPKKLQTNSKALEARERKETVKKEKNAALVAQVEREQWADEGSTAREQRQREKAEKASQEAAKRQAKKEQLAKEEAESSSIKLAKAGKITQFQLKQAAEAKAKLESEAAIEREMAAKKLMHQIDLKPNVNDVSASTKAADEAQFGKGNVISASSIDEALEKLQLDADSRTRSSGGKVDMNPEKRLKAAFRAYEEENLPILKAENPTLKFSQLKDRLWEQWQKAPTNPIVIRRKAEMEAQLAH